ncbi:MAG TPA: hypothetical protein VFS57_02545 [Gemmatimonadaceae bacterium]|nr:hypothetical protein [Gemmatimonadaceae bacterium]
MSDWPSLGDPSDSIVLQIAARYLDNCAAAYKPHTYKAIAVMNTRTTAIPAAMTDAAWSRYLLLVCDFAMGHLSTRLASKVGRSADDVRADLRRSLVPGAFAVPSGIFGLARAQNAGCALVRM